MRPILLLLVIGVGILGPAPAAPAVDSVLIAAIDFDYALMATAPVDDYERLFILEKAGQIHIVDLLTGTFNADVFLDIQGLVSENNSLEQGLLGLAFHPEYSENGYFFVYYTDNDGNQVLSRWSVDPDDPDLADDLSETILLTIDKSSGDHNGGWMEFGSDGYLYMSVGDDRTDANGQETDTLLGKILRLDVNDFDSDTYAVPDDNPFVAALGVEDEIWATGLRNPYIITFDPGTDDLYIADVGPQTEEINVIAGDSTGGENFGWECVIGTDCSCECVVNDFIDPIHDYEHLVDECAIIGGYVYRGAAISDLEGVYVYTDWCSGQILGLTWDGTEVTDTFDYTADLVACEQNHIGRDAFGELYIVSRGCDELHKIVPDDLADRDCNDNNIIDQAEIDLGWYEDCNLNGVPDTCEIEADPLTVDANDNGVVDSCELAFIRGDANDDGEIDLADSIFTLDYIFLGGPGTCLNALDSNHDGSLDVSDPIYLLGYTFLSGDDPPAPHPDCDTPASASINGLFLGCEEHTFCNP